MQMLQEVEDPDVSMSTIAHPFSWTGSRLLLLLLLLVGRVGLVAPLPRHGLMAVGLLNNKCAINVMPCCYRSSHGSHGAMVGLGLALDIREPHVSMSTSAYRFSWTRSLLLFGGLHLHCSRLLPPLSAPLTRKGLLSGGLLNNKCAINLIRCCYRSSHGSHGAVVGLGLALDSSRYLLGFGRVGQCGLARRCAERLALLVASRGGCPLPVQQQNHSVINRKKAHQDAEMPGMQH